MLRQVGKGLALVVFVVDVFLKGSAAVIPARALLGAGAYGWLVAAGLAALAGHIWPIWLGGKGGKAVATGFGMLLGLVPAVGLACLGVFLTSLALSRIVSISSVLAAAALPLDGWCWSTRGLPRPGCCGRGDGDLAAPQQPEQAPQRRRAAAGAKGLTEFCGCGQRTHHRLHQRRTQLRLLQHADTGDRGARRTADHVFEFSGGAGPCSNNKAAVPASVRWAR